MRYKMSGPSLYPNLRRSTDGFRNNSEDKNQDALVIKGNKISMSEEDGGKLKKGDIKGTGLTTGNTKIMKPGKNYTFAGDNEVLETPMAKKGCTCWKTHERVPGTKPCASGSCRKK